MHLQLQELQRLVQQYPVLILASSKCDRCNSVKDQLRSHKLEYQHFEIDKKRAFLCVFVLPYLIVIIHLNLL